METSFPSDRDRRPAAADGDDDEAGAADKLIPEWGARADDQVLVIGLAVVLALALALGWSLWRGGDDGPVGDLLPPSPDDGAIGAAVDELDAVGEATPTTIGSTTTTEADEAAVTTAESTTTSQAAASVGDVQAAVDPFPGSIAGSADGTIAVLDGFVANQAESNEAESAAAEVEGITEVRNNLVLLEPAITTALEEAGVRGATAVGIGTEITVSGTIDTEDDRAPAIEAAEGVDGVTSIIDDRLNVSVTADLNALPQVQFATASSVILAESFGDLDDAAALLTEAGAVQIEVQGYTDIEGEDAANLELSQERADAVRAYLVDQGVGDAELTAVGFGETEQFGEDLAANRLVRFQQVDR